MKNCQIPIPTIVQLQNFMEDNDYIKIEWDGDDLTLFNDRNEPWSIRELRMMSKTWLAFTEIEKALELNEVRPFVLTSTINVS